MKTIEQIFKENGEQFPFKVVSGANRVFFHCVARAPSGSWVGWDGNGCAVSRAGAIEEWELCREPKVEEKRYEWLVFTTSVSAYVSGSLYTVKEAKKEWPSAIKLVPQRELDEVTGKLVEVKL